MGASLTVRAATSADKEVVLRFCQHTFDWGDYLPEVWDRWLSEEDSRLMVGEVDGRPVAVGNVRRVTDDEAWLQGLRIDPAYRGSGLAHAFTVSAARAAADMGARVVRLMTMPTTVAIHKVMDGLGFQRKATLVSYRADAAADLAAEPLDVLDLGDVDAALGFLENSPVFAAMGRLRCVGWVCDELTRSKLLPRLERGDVWARRSNSSIAALAIVQRESEEHLQIEFADGDELGLAALAISARRRAALAGSTGVLACLATIPRVLRAFEIAGFDPEGHEFWVFEKVLSEERLAQEPQSAHQIK